MTLASVARARAASSGRLRAAGVPCRSISSPGAAADGVPDPERSSSSTQARVAAVRSAESTSATPNASPIGRTALSGQGYGTS